VGVVLDPPRRACRRARERAARYRLGAAHTRSVSDVLGGSGPDPHAAGRRSGGTVPAPPEPL